MNREKILKGLLPLLGTSIFWGSSFPAIKVAVGYVGGELYTGMRSLLTIMLLAPYVWYKRHLLTRDVVKGGLLVGLAYTLGIWLQGWGTGLTTASKSAFITGMNVPFVHAYMALVLRKYDRYLAISLGMSLLGLYLLTRPDVALNIGDFLVLLGAVFWAAQIIMVSHVSRADPLLIVFLEMIPGLVFLPVGLARTGIEPLMDVRALLVLLYLALVCTIGAFGLQVYGQRHISAGVAAIVYLLEPVFAGIFSYIALGETMDHYQLVGAGLIVLAIAVSSMMEDQETGSGK